ncbi:unnamed protein product [Hymenolepis diminuta]|uniref:Uncharacterized protein n=1 Tax=Hymenolepis diminuta TaxID=6216 RepID=A0A0R3S9F0_HYMDI|nr:unnamed protein product [Hymenolepis diminuta]
MTSDIILTLLDFTSLFLSVESFCSNSLVCQVTEDRNKLISYNQNVRNF